MNNLQVFKNTEFGELKVLVIDGKEYFPATDCARMLGYSNPRDADKDHCKPVRGRETRRGHLN
jgi:prophage antirepressor-like protein